MGHVARADLESLLRARKLDITLTTTAPTSTAWAADGLAPTGVTAIDAALGGGLRRGHLSEIVGPRSAGRTSLLCQLFAAFAGRGELIALIDACDRFDPASAAAAGVDLSALLWVRLSDFRQAQDCPELCRRTAGSRRSTLVEGRDSSDATRALKAMNLVLQAGGFGVVALDVADVSTPALRQLPYTTWIRLARVIEGSQTVALLVTGDRLARSPGGVTIALDAPADLPRGRWTGEGDRARRLEGVEWSPRIITAR